MHRQRILGSGIILGTILVLSLVAAGVMRHRASAQASGICLLWTDVVLLAIYGFAGMVVWKQTSPRAITAAIVGAQIGLVVGAVQIANHLIEAFVPTRPFVLIISPVLLALALLGTAGAAAWERTRSLVLAVISGVCCAIVATLITLCFAISFNLLFAARVDWQLREAFAASGMIDRAGFRVRYPGSVVRNTCSYASLSHLLGLCWGHHPSMDEPRIPSRACTDSQIPGPVSVCTRCGRAVARQHDRTCCATTFCAIRSPACRSCSVCCVSDLVSFPRFDRHV